MCEITQTLIRRGAILRVVLVLLILLFMTTTVVSQEKGTPEVPLSSSSVTSNESTGELMDFCIVYFSNADTYISESEPGDNFGSLSYLSASPHCNTTNSEKRILVNFSEPIASSSVIKSAILHLNYYAYEGVNPANRSLTAKRITSNWSESSVNWNNQPPTESFYPADTLVPSSYKTMAWDVTASVLYNLDNYDDSMAG